MGAERSYIRIGMSEKQLATITLASSHTLGRSNLTTLSTLLAISVAMAGALHPGSACTSTCEHVSREMKSVKLAGGDDIEIPIWGLTTTTTLPDNT